MLTAPNGGESWQVPTVHNIIWVSEPTSTQFVLTYSNNNGTSWNAITSSTYATTYAWTMPNDPTTQALVKVQDYNNSCIYDISGAVFTIMPPAHVITVTNPNTATTRYIGVTSNIT